MSSSNHAARAIEESPAPRAVEENPALSEAADRPASPGMTPAQRELWERIAAFRFDDPAAKLQFSARLARDNGWSRSYAERVLREYRRFTFLAIAAGHPATPSEDIDAAWHLHLIYTRSYWEEFCPHVLGQPLHHGPTRGGSAEHVKHHAWYAKTLASYRRFFGPPPADIWPAPEHRFAPRRMVPVDRLRNWVIPKPVRVAPRVVWAGVGLLLLVLVGCAAEPFSTAELLKLKGPEFLSLYMPVLIGTFLAALTARYFLQAPTDAWNLEEAERRPYEIAYAAGGLARAIEAATAALVRKGILAISDDGTSLKLIGVPATDSHLLELRLCERVDLTGNPRFSTAERRELTLAFESKLRELGLWLSDASIGGMRFATAVLLVPVLWFGITKASMGVQAGKPTGALIVSLLFAGGYFLFLMFRRPELSPRGEKTLAALKARTPELRTGDDPAAPALTAERLALGVGLLGVGILAGGALASVLDWRTHELAELQSIHRANASGGASGCAGGCGTSGDSGGGGDGGSGCGGGGCGGCGGGGD